MSKTKPIITTISGDDTYHGWPTVGRLDDGTLLVVSSSGREDHVCPFGKLRMQQSKDNGATWSEPRVLFDGPLDDRDAGLLVTSKGTILVTWFTSLAWMVTLGQHEVGAKNWLSPEKLEVWRHERERVIRSVKDVRQVHGEFLIRSTDGGKTWSEPIRAGASSPHGPTELADGGLLFVGKPTAPHIKWATGSTFASTPVSALRSEDDGLTWHKLGSVPCAEGDTDDDYHEPHAVQAADGRIVAMIRDHSDLPGIPSLACESFDGGETWTTPRPMSFGDHAHPVHLLRLTDGRLVATFGYREKPYGNRACVSEDHGRTWSEPYIISDDGTSHDLGYPSTTELDDGGLLSVWYERVPELPMAVLRQAIWRL